MNLRSSSRRFSRVNFPDAPNIEWQPRHNGTSAHKGKHSMSLALIAMPLPSSLCAHWLGPGLPHMAHGRDATRRRYSSLRQGFSFGFMCYAAGCAVEFTLGGYARASSQKAQAPMPAVYTQSIALSVIVSGSNLPRHACQKTPSVFSTLTTINTQSSVSICPFPFVPSFTSRPTSGRTDPTGGSPKRWPHARHAFASGPQ